MFMIVASSTIMSCAIAITTRISHRVLLLAGSRVVMTASMSFSLLVRVSGTRRCVADLQELQPERLDLGEHAVERCLIGQRSGEHGLSVPRVRLEPGERDEQPVAQYSPDTDLVQVGRGICVHEVRGERLGAVLRPGRRAALAWADLIDTSDELTLFQRPHLDILSYFPTRRRLSEIDHASAHVLNTGMHLPTAQSLFVATYTVDGSSLTARGHQVAADVASGRILRSVLMKPETEEHVPALHQQVLDLLDGS